MVKIDAYLIPADHAQQYIRERTLAIQRIETAMLTFCSHIEYGGKDSEDGEFITGINQDGQYIAFMHLGPAEVEAVNACTTEQELIALLQSQ